jgi:hypothetical protein
MLLQGVNNVILISCPVQSQNCQNIVPYSVKCTQNRKFTQTFFYLWMDLKYSYKIIKGVFLFELFISTKLDKEMGAKTQ